MFNFEVEEDELFILLRKIGAYQFSLALMFRMKVWIIFSFYANKERVLKSKQQLRNKGFLDEKNKVIFEKDKLLKK